MTNQEVLKIAEETAATFYTTVDVRVWKEERVYLTRPDQSKKYQDVGYVRLSDGKAFPSCGNNPRTSRDKDAIDFCEAVSNAILSAR